MAENLLHKVQDALEHPEIAVCDTSEWRLRSYTFRGRDFDDGYEWQFKIAPKTGIYKIDEHTGTSIIELGQRVFRELLSEEYLETTIPFHGVSASWGVSHDGFFQDRVFPPRLFSIPRLLMFEPIGVEETRKEKHWRRTILPEHRVGYPTGWTPEVGKWNQHEHSWRSAIKRTIAVSFFPSTTYLERVKEFERETDMKMKQPGKFDHDLYEKKGLEFGYCGFQSENRIFVPNYNAFFAPKMPQKRRWRLPFVSSE